MIRDAVNGSGVIGKLVVDAVRAMPSTPPAGTADAPDRREPARATSR